MITCRPPGSLSKWIAKAAAGAVGVCALFFITAEADAQTDTTWNGGTGSWFDPANWNTETVPNGSNNVFIDGGKTGSNSVIEAGNSATIDIESLHVDSGDTLNIGNNFDFKITTNGNSTSGVINNDGNINLTSAGSFTDLIIKNDVTLDGSGILTLDGNSGNSRIIDESGADGHLNNSSKIHGQGQIGANTLQLTNAADGWIDANIDGGTLTLDTNAAGAINQGKMRALNGGNLLITGETVVNNDGGMIRAANNSTVTLAGNAEIQSGLLETTGNGSIEILTGNSATLTGVTIDGTINQKNNTDLSLNGTINNTGNINTTSLGSFADLRIEGATSLTGGGTITLAGANARILDESGTLDGVLTNVDTTIQGRGNIGYNRTEIINQGLIDANDSDGTLTLDPRNTGNQFTNSGTLRASGGGELVLNGNGGQFLNSGRIEAIEGSTVRLQNVASIDGGDLESFGSGRFVVGPSQNGEIKDVNFKGQFDIENNTDLELFGTINNQGSFSVTSLGSFTDLQVNGNVALTGGGSISLDGGSNNSRILDEDGPAEGVLSNVDNTIQGRGNIGYNRTEIINQGLIDANDSDGTLTLDPRNTGDQFTNSGTLRASGGGELVLNGTGGGQFLNSGRIEALEGSTVRLQNVASIDGGDLESFGSGRFVVGPSQNGEIKDVNFKGQFDVENNTDLELFGTINNQGSFSVTSLGSFTDLQVNGDVFLTGGGTIELGGSSSNSRILDESGPAEGVLTNVDNTIQGRGNIGYNRTQIVNQMAGLISADVSGQTLTIDNIGVEFTNQGMLKSEASATLFLADSLTNEGLIQADGVVNVSTDSLFNTSTGTIQGNGTIDSVVTNDGTIGPGASVGSLTIDGDTTFGTTSFFDVEVDATGADLLTVLGDLSIDGELSLSLLANFDPDALDTFTIASADSDILGAFDNVSNGSTLLTDGGEGTFIVNYGAGSAFATNSIVLSGFTVSAVPEPGTATAMFALLTGSLLVRRRRI